MSRMRLLVIATTCLIALASPSEAFTHSRRLLQDNGRTAFALANSTLDQAKAVVAALDGSGDAAGIAGLSSSSYQAAFRASNLAGDLADEDNGQEVATANALSGAAGVAAAAAAAGYSSNSTRVPELNQAIAEVETLLNAIESTPTTDVPDRVEDAATAAASASQAAVAAVNAIVVGNSETIGRAFDEADEAADDADDASDEGAGSAAIRASETVGHVLLATGYAYQANNQSAWSSAVDAGLSAHQTAVAAAATTSSDGGCSNSGTITDSAESASDIIDDDDFDNDDDDDDDDDNGDVSQKVERAIAAATELVAAARSACPLETAGISPSSS